MRELIVCVAAPLLVVNPIGERCFFATYILFLMLLLELLILLDGEEKESRIFTKTFCKTCAVVSIFGLGFYLNIFSSIYQVDKERLARINLQKFFFRSIILHGNNIFLIVCHRNMIFNCLILPHQNQRIFGLLITVR